MIGSWENRSYLGGIGIAVLTSILTLWTTVVRDDGTGIGWFLIILGAGVGAFAAWFRPAGMARTMLGVAIMQMLFALAIATAPSAGGQPDGGLRALALSGVFTALWLLSAASFRAAWKSETGSIALRN